MTQRPVDYGGKTYYPTRSEACGLCEFFEGGTDDKRCIKFRHAQSSSDYVCLDSDSSESVIWRTGESAMLQHFTERLTT